jgi:selenide, water dikinase
MSVKLTQLSHGGGCGCKISPAVLADILAKMPARMVPPQLLVGNDSSDDAAVYQLNDQQAIVATTDFFMPIVDDPFDFGRIAATNALSDVYAMGGTPLFALAIVGMPINQLPTDVIQQILQGGEAICAAAGIPIAGGHSIDAPEPIYGLVAIGVVHPANIKRNDRARPGDRLILGKGLGVGILSAALKKDELDSAGYQHMLASTTQLNTPGAALADWPGVHALTDVTGFGLLGHLLEICRGAQLTATVDFARLPLLPGVAELAQKGVVTGASGRNWQSFGHDVRLPADLAPWQQALLTDPQTSGGLLVAVAPEAEAEVLALFKQQGFDYAAAIGTLAAGAPQIIVR